MKGREWDRAYRSRSLSEIPWHSGQPDRRLVQLIREGRITQGRVLDMCSGDGTNSIYLASRGFEVVGVDISPTAVEIAQQRCQKRNVSCDYHVGSVLDFTYDKTFDLIFDRGCFHHISKIKKPQYVDLVKNLLRKKGKLFLLCFSDKNPPFKKNLSREDIRSYFAKDFEILFIKDSVHIEPDDDSKRYLFACFMQKKDRITR